MKRVKCKFAIDKKKLEKQNIAKVIEEPKVNHVIYEANAMD